jgi:hypothetical protein
MVAAWGTHFGAAGWASPKQFDSDTGRVAGRLVVPEGSERLSQPPWHSRHRAAGDAGDGDEPRVDACLLPAGTAYQLDSAAPAFRGPEG